MNVSELFQFTEWLKENGAFLLPKFQALGSALQHNSTQPQKQPIKEPLDDLIYALENTPLDELSNEQIQLLSTLEIGHLVGPAGAKHIIALVKEGDFDPATASAELQKDIQAFSQAIQGMKQIHSALSPYNILTEVSSPIDGQITIRVQFKEGAAIEDVVQWKKWSNEWYDIIRGIALSLGEAPEDTKVIGASKGSLVMILSGTVAFTGALALIAKHLTSIIKNVLQIANTIEDLRHKKFLNKTIENNLKKQSEKIKSDGVKTILAETKKALDGRLNGEQEQALERSISKFLKFSDLGGDIDFVSPPETYEDDEDRDDDKALPAAEIAEIRKVIHEIHSLRDEVKLLTHQEPDTDDIE